MHPRVTRHALPVSGLSFPGGQDTGRWCECFWKQEARIGFIFVWFSRDVEKDFRPILHLITSMPRAKRARKQPLVSSAAPTISHKATQATISRFHTLLKRRSVLERALDNGPASDAVRQELCKVNSDIEALGGLEAYQHASTLGQSSQRGGDSSKVLVRWLKELRSDKSTPIK